MENRLTRVLADLIAIESVNPAYPGGERGEVDVADYVDHYCRSLGLDVSRSEVLPGRENVLAELRVPGARHTILFEAHMDTVGLEPMGPRALQPEIRNGRIYGRGACDTKGSLAAMLGAMEALVARRGDLGVNLLLLASVDEEDRYRGILSFLQNERPVHGAIVGEPTDLRVVIATKGCVRFRLTTSGRAAHSANPEKGENAIDRMADVLVALRSYQSALATRTHPLVGHPTLSVGRIWGGLGVNIVPDQCTIEIDRRIIPGEDPAGAMGEIDRVLAGPLELDPAIRWQREEPFLVDWALDTSLDAMIVQAARHACQEVGVSGEPIGVPYGTDASKLWALGQVPSIVFGPGSIEQAHTADEFVPIAQLVRASEVLVRSALSYTTLVQSATR